MVEDDSEIKIMLKTMLQCYNYIIMKKNRTQLKITNKIIVYKQPTIKYQ